MRHCIVRLTCVCCVGLLHCPALCGGEATTQPESGPLLRIQYQRLDTTFCNAPICADFDGDGQKEVVFANRNPYPGANILMLRAADGAEIWTNSLQGKQQSLIAADVDGDRSLEIVYSVSSPGILYLLSSSGTLLKQFDSGDGKLGNSPVIIDADGDGILEGYFGSRTKYLLSVNLSDLTLIARRPGWSQCGCYTTAMDVDHDGRWDLFAGSGDDELAKGVLHRYEPLSLQSAWELPSNDNASSADMVLVDIDNDGDVEIIKSVDNYHQDDAHDAVYALETDGTVLWKVPGISGEDSPNVADLDGDGAVEIVGMTFGGEVYCLDAAGQFKWRRDLRPEFDDAAHAYVSPLLCDVDGDADLEVLAMTNGPFYTGDLDPEKPHGIIFALSAEGEVLGQLDVGGPRYWNDAFYCNMDDDPQMELAVAGWGGLDVIETRGLGADVEVFQRRRTYQRLNVYPWAYEDTFFLSRGDRQHVRNQADDLVLERDGGRYQPAGRFRTELLTLPPDCEFTTLTYGAQMPPGAKLAVNVLDDSGAPLATAVDSGSTLEIDQPVMLEFLLSTDDPAATPRLDAYSLRFARQSL